MSDIDAETLSIVLDSGSHKIKAGFSGDDSPRAVFPTVVGRTDMGGDEQACYIGDAAYNSSRLPAITLSRPVEDGVITNWGDMELVWDHLYNNELRVSSEDQPVFVTEVPLCSQSNRDKMAEVLFEKLKVPSCAIMATSLPALIASGRTCGLIVESGFDVTSVTPLYDAHVFKEGVRRMNLAGRHISECLEKLLNQRGYTFPTLVDQMALEDLKRDACFVSPDGGVSAETTTAKSYQMTNSINLTATSERYRATECLFDPSLAGKAGPGLAAMVHESIQSCDESLRTDLYRNIILAGSSTMFQGIVDRLSSEVSKLAQEGVSVKVIAPPERRASVWIGGSILTSLSFSDNMWVTKHQYQESGAQALYTDWEPPPGLEDTC